MSGAVGKRLHNGVINGKANRCAHRAHRTLKALESVAAKGDFLSQSGEGEKGGVCQQP